jgi:hypothetical protein
MEQKSQTDTTTATSSIGLTDWQAGGGGLVGSVIMGPSSR